MNIPEGDVVDVAANVAEVARARLSHPDHLVLASLERDQLPLTNLAKPLLDVGADAVHIRVGAEATDLLDRIEVAERFRLAGVPVAVESGGDDLDHLSAGILAGRLDLVTLPEAVAR